MLTMPCQQYQGLLPFSNTALYNLRTSEVCAKVQKMENRGGGGGGGWEGGGGGGCVGGGGGQPN